MRDRPRAWRLLLAGAAWLLIGPPAQAEEPAPPASGYECTASFFDRQDGEKLGEKSFSFEAAEIGGKDPVEVCLDRAARAPLPRALAFQCRCRAR